MARIVKIRPELYVDFPNLELDKTFFQILAFPSVLCYDTMSAGDLNWILHRNCEGTEQLLFFD